MNQRPQLSHKSESIRSLHNLKLSAFDPEYFNSIRGDYDWIATDYPDVCFNPRYFTVYDEKNTPLGVIGIYDTNEDRNVTHTIVAPSMRGRGLAQQFKDKLMNELGLAFVTLLVDLDNDASIKAAEKLPGVKRVSDKTYETEFNKAKYIYPKS